VSCLRAADPSGWYRPKIKSWLVLLVAAALFSMPAGAEARTVDGDTIKLDHGKLYRLWESTRRSRSNAALMDGEPGSRPAVRCRLFQSKRA